MEQEISDIITSKIILDKIKNNKVLIMGGEEIIEYLSDNHHPEVLLTMGAGDIGLLVKKIEKQFIKV